MASRVSSYERVVRTLTKRVRDACLPYEIHQLVVDQPGATPRYVSASTNRLGGLSLLADNSARRCVKELDDVLTSVVGVMEADAAEARAERLRITRGPSPLRVAYSSGEAAPGVMVHRLKYGFVAGRHIDWVSSRLFVTFEDRSSLVGVYSVGSALAGELKRHLGIRQWADSTILDVQDFDSRAPDIPRHLISAFRQAGLDFTLTADMALMAHGLPVIARIPTFLVRNVDRIQALADVMDVDRIPARHSKVLKIARFTSTAGEFILVDARSLSFDATMRNYPLLSGSIPLRVPVADRRSAVECMRLLGPQVESTSDIVHGMEVEAPVALVTGIGRVLIPPA